MPTVQDYLNLIPSQNSSQPKFTAMIAAIVAPFVQVQLVLDSMIPLFDLDTPPVGNQLDIIGQWVGASRNVNIPITGIFFTWNGTDLLGWDSGIWQDPNGVNSITSLPDSSYLPLILAKIASNSWDGTTEGAYKIWGQVFPQYTLLIEDYQNMSFSIIISGGVLDALTQALLTQGYLPLRPQGVQIRSYFLPINTDPLFGWNIENAYFQGWGIGNWANEITGS